MLVEKCYLRGLLCGHSPEEIAGKLYRQPGGVTAYLSRTVYQYVKELTGHDKMRSYEDISKWLGENYRRSKPGASSSQQQESIFEGELSMTIMKSVAVVGVFNNCRIFIDRQKNTVKIESNHFQLEASPLPEKNKTGTD